MHGMCVYLNRIGTFSTSCPLFRQSCFHERFTSELREKIGLLMSEERSGGGRKGGVGVGG